MTKPKIISERVEVIDIDALKVYRKNARVGNLEAIAESLTVNGQFRPLTVNRRTMEILVGNHTWKAAKSLGWSKIAVTFVDVSDKAAAKIVLADNRTNDLSSYDTFELSELLKEVQKNPVGTGFTESDVSQIIDGIVSADTDSLEAVFRPNPVQATDEQKHDAGNFQPPEADNRFIPPADLGEPDAVESVTIKVLKPESPPEDAEGDFELAPEEMSGAYGLKFNQRYEGVGAWGIPPLLPSMLAQPDDIPRNLLAWAGSATKDWPDDSQWWLYNYGVDSTSGMKDVSKSIMSFYCWDEYFEPWWTYPDRFTGKMLNSGIKMALTPDFSTWGDEPRVLSLMAIYKSRYLGRYFQEAGIKLIPHLTWPTGDYDFYDNVVRATLPKELPVVSLQLQTFDSKPTPEQLKDAIDFMRHVGQTCNPDLTIFYVGQNGRKLLEENPDIWPGEHLIVNNRMRMLALQAKKRQAKNTI